MGKYKFRDIENIEKSLTCYDSCVIKELKYPAVLASEQREFMDSCMLENPMVKFETCGAVSALSAVITKEREEKKKTQMAMRCWNKCSGAESEAECSVECLSETLAPGKVV